MTEPEPRNFSNPAPGVVRPANSTAPTSGMSRSMHDGVEVWCDCCSCEAEPYWLEAFENREPMPNKD